MWEAIIAGLLLIILVPAWIVGMMWTIDDYIEEKNTRKDKMRGKDDDDRKRC